MPSAETADRTALRRAQAWLSGAIAASVLATSTLVMAAAHSERMNEWVDGARQEHWRRDNSLYVHKQGFLDLASRIQLRDVPEADYSRGGVYFFGTSKVASFLKTWELAPELRPLIGNFGMGGLVPVHQDNLIRYLVEDRALLEAGPERVMVVLGLFWGDAEALEKGGRPFVNAWTRYQTHSYDLERGLHPTSGGLHHSALTHLGTATNFLHTLQECVTLDRDWKVRVRPLFRSNPDHGPSFYRDKWTEAMGPDWRRNMAVQIDGLRASIRYLRERDVEVHLVQLPDPSWFEDLPYPAIFEELTAKLAEQEDVPFHDMTDLLGDEEFADHAHANHTGAVRAHAALMDLAEAFLRRTGALAP